MRTTHTVFLYANQDPHDPQNPYGTAEELEQKFYEISRATRSLRFAALEPGEIPIHAGAIFPDATIMARSVAEALIDHPERFPDIHLSGHELLQRLRQALAWADFEEQLLWLARRAGETKHKLLGPVIIDAQAALKRVQASDAQPEPYVGSGPHAASRRELTMGPAQQRLEAYRSSLQKIRRRLKMLRAQKAATATAAGPPQNRQKPSPQMLRAERQNTTRVLAGIYSVFDARARDTHRAPELHRSPIVSIPPEQTPQPEPAPATGAAAPPSPQERLKHIFAARYDQPDSSFESALTISAADLKAAKEAAAAEFESIPRLSHTPEQREKMAGKRYPGLTTVARMMAHGLERHEEIVEDLQVTPELVLEAIAQDDAATQLAVAGDMIFRGAEDGSILASATMETLAVRILSQVQQARSDRRTPADLRYDLHTAFAAAEALRAERLRRLQKTKAQNQRAAQDQTQQPDPAEQTATETGLINAFLAAIKNR